MKQFFIEKYQKWPKVNKMNILLIGTSIINNNTAIEFLKKQSRINL